MHFWRFSSIGLVSLAMLVVASAGTVVAQDAPQAAVNMDQYQFKPQELVVSPGTTVIWTNFDPAAHTVTADDQSWSSELISRDGQFTMTFDTPGTYGYYCMPHGTPGSGMFGTIVVAAPDDASATVNPQPSGEEAPPAAEVPAE